MRRNLTIPYKGASEYLFLPSSDLKSRFKAKLDGFFPINDMQTPCQPLRPPKLLYLHVPKMPTVLKRMKNQFSDLCDFSFLSYGRFCLQFSSLSPTKNDQKHLLSFKSGHICVKDAQCAEKKREINVVILPIFSFWDMVAQNLTI